MSFFRRKAKHPLIRIILLLLVVGAVAFFFFKDIKKASAEWFDQNWFYRQAITITVTSSASDVSNLDTWFTMSTSALISASKLQSSCQDLRFTNANGKLLPYYIDSGCNTTATKIWVKADLVPKNSTTYTVYAYYGNANAVAASDSTKFNLYKGLVGYWNMNESSGNLTDSSGNSATGVVTGTTVASGKFGNGRIFNGTSESANPGVIMPTGAYTKAAWIKKGSQAVNNNILSGDSDSQHAFWAPTSSFKLSAGHNGAWSSVQDPTALDSNWHHVVVTYDPNTSSGLMVLYKDGVEVNRATGVAAPTLTTRQLYIGNYAGGNFFDGSMDEARVYNRALSASEVSQLYNDGTSSILTAVQGQSAPSVSFATEEKGPAPVAAWRFDEGQGLTAFDDSTNNNDGTLSGTTKPSWQTGDMCVSGKCLKFDGSTSYIDAGSPTSLQLTDNFTYELWYKPNSTATGVVAISNGWLPVMWSNYDGKPFWDIDKGGGTTASVHALSALQVGTWYHLVGVYSTADGSSASRFYINGVLQGSAASVGTLSPPGNVNIGRLAYQAATYSNGFIDSVKIYPYARTVAQIKADYNSRGSVSGTSAKIGGESAWMTNGLVGFWKMDEASGAGSTLADSSGAGNTGTAVLWGGGNTATDSAHVAGKFGNAFSFDGGDDYVDFGTGASLFPTSAITLGAWIYHAGGSSNQFAIGSGLVGNYRYGLIWQQPTGKMLFSFYTTSWADRATSRAIPENTWVHIVGTYDGSRAKIYYNGVLDDDQAVTGALAYPASPHAYFGNALAANHWWNGKADEVRIYNRALSAKEVADLYNFAPGPVGWWKMDDKVSGNSQTLVDSSGNGNNGTTYYGANATGMNCKVIGKYGGGCLLDGVDDYIGIADSSSYDVGNSMTIEAWINLPAVNSRQPIFSSRTSDTTGMWQFEVGSGAGGTGKLAISTPGIWNAETSENVISTNQWYHVAYTRNGTGAGSQKFYVNGVSKSLVTDSLVAFVDSANARGIGVGTGYTYFTTGSIDDVRLYNYPRSQKQILEDMNAGHPSVGSPVGSYAAWWKFDEGHDNTLNDQSVNTNTGTNHGAVWTNDGKFGKALSFDGLGSYVQIANAIAIKNSTNFSYEAWVYISSLPGARQEIFTQAWQSWLEISAANQWKFGFYDGSSDKTISTNASTGWHHLVGTFDGSYLRLYVDSVAVTPVAQTTAPSRDDAAPTIGSYSGSSNFFKGIIDEVKIYPFALTASDIQTEYNRGSALQMGSLSDTSGLTGGSVASNSASAAYCIPGDTTSCAAPVGEWNFNEKVSGNSQTLYDTSGNGNNGTTYWGANVAGMNCKAIGKYGSACQLDGVDDYVSIGNPASLQITGSMTVGFWLKMAAYTGDWQQILWKRYADGGSLQQGWQCYGHQSQNTLYCSTWYNNVQISVSSAYTPNVWTYWEFTRDGSNQRLYKNGVLVSGPTADTTTIGTATNLLFGTYGNAQFLNGTLDNVQIFNYARTPAQVAWDYNKGKPVGYWKFDECQGKTAYDSSGNGNTGTITIGATGSQTTAGICTTSGAWYNGLSGKMNSALNFDGTDDYVQVADSNSLDMNNGVTLSAWIYYGETPSSSIRTIFAKEGTWSGTSDNYQLDVRESGKIEFAYRGSDSSGNEWKTTKPVIAASTWYHVVLTYDGTNNPTIYVNGVAQAASYASGGNKTLTGNAQPLYIGALVGPSNYLIGKIDDAKVYNYALTAQQVKLDYNQGAAVRFGPSTGRP